MANNPALRSVRIMLNGQSYVYAGFRDAVVDAANRDGMSVFQFAMIAMGEKLQRMGRDIPGVFARNDISLPANDPADVAKEKVA